MTRDDEARELARILRWLRGGVVVAVETERDRLRVVVRLPEVRARFAGAGEGAAFVLRLEKEASGALLFRDPTRVPRPGLSS